MRTSDDELARAFGGSPGGTGELPSWFPAGYRSHSQSMPARRGLLDKVSLRPCSANAASFSSEQGRRSMLVRSCAESGKLLAPHCDYGHSADTALSRI
jgi:hypothetical protein